jgi:beta-fructofuranosidase
VALAPTPGGPDQDGCFTGSAIDDRGTATFLYTGISAVPPERATLKDPGHNYREVVCLATSADSDLRTLTKLPRPVLEPPADPLIAGFRDPFLWQEGAFSYLGVGSGQRNQGGRVLLYRSADLRHWDSAGVLASGTWNGKHTSDVVDSGEMWECPDFFPLGKKYVLIYSTERRVYWASGELNRREMKFYAQKKGLLDSGAYYAPKTQTAANGDRILWGWITETRPEAEFSKAGWAGCMSLPRVLSLDSDDALVMRPVSSISKLRTTPYSLPALPLPERLNLLRDFRIHGSSAEILLTIHRALFAMNLMAGPQSFVTLSFDPNKSGAELSLNGADFALHLGNSQHIYLRLFIDGSVVELFANERACHTTRIYRAPLEPLSLQIPDLAFASLVTLQAWQITPISPDRLTT